MKTGPERNDLLFFLPLHVKKRVFPQLREIELPWGKEVAFPHQQVKFVYFPVDCIIALSSVTLDGRSTEISVVGREGFVGTSVLLGADSTPNQAITESAGTAYRLAATDFKYALENDGYTRILMLSYVNAQIAHMAQTALCNRHHTVDQQFCRWLLLRLDRLPTKELFRTQEWIAGMLGVRRESVTEAACRLHKLGIIHYTRGHIEVLDRPRLEEISCDCYAAVKKEPYCLAA